MKNKNYNILFLLLFLISCTDFLEEQPDTQTSIKEQFETRNGVLAALNGIYRDLENVSSTFAFLYADVQSGNIKFTPSRSSKIVNIPSSIRNSYSFTDTQEDSDYRFYYRDLYEIINQTNVILEAINSFDFFTLIRKNQLRAELLAVRSFAHFQVSLFYAQSYNFTTDASHLGIIYNTKTLAVDENFPARKTMKETYDLLKLDFNQALSIFQQSQLLTGPTYSLFNKTTTTALFARVALQMNDWQTALNLADEVIKNSGIKLTTKENYITEWELISTPISEIILEFTVPRTNSGLVSSTISQYFKFNSNTDYGDFVASEDLIDLFDINDIRKELFILQNLETNVNGTLQNLPYYFTKKFQDNAGTTCIRLSEMYLIRAEAYARLNKNNDALIDLNSIRERANLNPLTTSANLLEEIFLERRRELAFEGLLLFDLARFKKNVVRNDGCLATTCNLNYPSNFFILPFPNSSVSLNPNMKQNPGY